MSYRNLSDNQLLGLVAEGNVKAYEVFFSKWYPVVLRFLDRMLKDSSAAKDVAQEIFIRIWMRRKESGRIESVPRYLYTACRNRVFDIFKSNWYRNTEPETREEFGVDSTEQIISYAETGEIIDRTVNAMPPQRRKVFRLNRYENKTCREIADELGLSERTIEKHLELALKDIRSRFN